MKTATVHTAVVVGSYVSIVRIHADIEPGESGIRLEGAEDLSDVEKHELLVRLRCCLEGHNGVTLTIDTVPQHMLPVASRGYDLPAVIAVALAEGKLPQRKDICFAMGELSLSGRVQPVRGVFGVALSIARSKYHRVIVPARGCCGEARDAGMPVEKLVAAHHVGEVMEALRVEGPSHEIPCVSQQTPAPSFDDLPVPVDSDIMSQIKAAVDRKDKKLLLIGPPGVGKTMIARRIGSLLPEMTSQEKCDVTAIRSIAGLEPGGLNHERPFRAPHHTVSWAGFVGTRKRPGELSLAHKGVLFLDEFQEFSGMIRESVVESKNRYLPWPAEPAMTVAAADPCPCGWSGWMGEPSTRYRKCECSKDVIRRHESRLYVDSFGSVIRLTKGACWRPNSIRTAELQSETLDRLNQAGLLRS